MLLNQSTKGTDQLEVQIDLSTPLLLEAPLAGHGRVVNPRQSRSPLLGQLKPENEDDGALDGAYRRFADKKLDQSKLRVINETFIDDLIEKRQRM